jgi:hypothetical protein
VPATKKGKFITVFVIIFFSTILLNNILYFLTTTEMLERSSQKESEMIAGDLRSAINRYHTSARFVEDLVGQELRAAAVAAKLALPPQAKDVTNEQLAELSEALGISHITLFQRVNGDIVGVKSSDPKEIGLSTKGWTFWFTAFQQLLDHKEVTIPEGQKLKYYWSGPIEHAATDPTYIDKWGYYYDGTTDYIINPFVHETQIKEFEKLVGHDQIVKEVLADNKFILEVTGFNPKFFGKSIPQYEGQNGAKFTSLYEKDIYFGSYEYKDPADVETVQTAISSKEVVTFSSTVDGKRLIKSFIPVTADTDIVGKEFPYVISIVMDYAEIRKQLEAQIMNAFYIIVLATILSIIFASIYTRIIRRTKEDAVQLTQDQFIVDMNKMFTTIRGQRHDFINHVQTIYSLISLNKFAEAKSYTKEFVDEILEVNDIIHIHHPVIASQVQAKVAMSITRKIRFSHEFHSLNQVSLNALKSVDIVKIIGNLVDNAFDEVVKLPADSRWVELKGWVEKDVLCLSVSNPCLTVPDEASLKQMFQPGFSTKRKGEHSGLGLSIVNDLLHQYRGGIRVTTSADTITFHVRLPLG